MPNGLSREQLQNAAVIYEVGRSVGASNRDIKIALMAALVESNLINVNYGDRDSLGLFQQRAAWAPASVRMDPYQSARMFFLGGRQGQRGLLDFSNRDQMGMGEAAQAVQVSAFPDRYATKLPLVNDIWPSVAGAAGAAPRDPDGDPYGTKPRQPRQDPPNPLAAPEFNALAAPTFGGLAAPKFGNLAAPDQGPAGEELTPISQETNKILQDLIGQNQVGVKGVNGTRAAIVDMARSFLGTPYVWGGTTPNGFDCSGLIQYIFSRQGIELPRISYQQARSGKRIGLKGLKPGDLVAWDNSSRNNGADHIAIYIGNGRIIEAPRPGLSVRIRKLGEGEGAWGVRMDI